ncbi:hypothetical protein C8R45DRAFT_1156647 [Mycena sanguinolenta]|nr:hypothetical protein C8R45DRAFT_1156647 [Mycena sanguinolenta]
MHFNSLNKIVFLSTALALQARADPALSHITQGDLKILLGNTAAPDPLLSTTADIPTTGPFVSTADNLIVNNTVPQGVNAALGWIDPIVAGVVPFSPVFDGSAYNVSVFYTPPGGVETVDTGSDTTDFCGIFSGYWVQSHRLFGPWNLRGKMDHRVRAKHPARRACRFYFGVWSDPFNTTTVEFTRNWEVVAVYTKGFAFEVVISNLSQFINGFMSITDFAMPKKGRWPEFSISFPTFRVD